MKSKNKSVTAGNDGVESFTIKLPAEMAKRLRLFGPVFDHSTPEAHIAHAIASEIEACSEAYHHNYYCDHDREEQEREAVALNTGGRHLRQAKPEVAHV